MNTFPVLLPADGRALSHAYLLCGDRAEAMRILTEYARVVLQVRLRGDAAVYEYDTLSVEDTRELKETGSRKSGAAIRIIVAAVNFATREAQNALLKLLEEPARGTHLFLIAPSPETFSPIVRSRLIVVPIRRVGDGAREEGAAFLDSPLPARLKRIKELAASVADEEASKADIIAFVAAVEAAAALRPRTPAWTSFLNDCALTKRYLSDRAPSVKMLLEHLALSVVQKQ